MNNPSQRPQPAEPDMVLLFLGSFLEDLLHAPVRDDAKLDALAMQILDEGPKTLLGLVIRLRAEKWLRRHLWALAFDSLSPLDQGVCVVIDSAMRIDCDRRAPHCSAGSGPSWPAREQTPERERAWHQQAARLGDGHVEFVKLQNSPGL
jgi:hypothetical protein